MEVFYMKKYLITLSICLLILTGCSSGNSYKSYPASVPNSVSEDGFNSFAVEGASTSFYDEEAKYESPVSDVNNENTVKKVIVTGEASVETLDYDNTVNKITGLVKKYNGYIQDSNTWKSSNGSRHTYFTARIPAESFDAFTSEAKDGENFTRFSTNTRDITDSYYDVQARIESLEAEEKVVLGFYDKAETIEDLITVENRLTDIRYELNSYKTQMKNYDLLTTYSTISFNIDEVQALSATTDSFSERLEKTCLRSWEDFKDFLEDALFWLIENVWYIIIWLCVIFFGWKVVKALINKKKGIKKAKAEKNVIKEDTPKDDKKEA